MQLDVHMDDENVKPDNNNKKTYVIEEKWIGKSVNKNLYLY
jgi:hypothetical protein